MFLPLPTPEEMAVWDHETIHSFGLPGMTLMENASREAVAVLLDEYGDVSGAEIHVFAGSGNNGGDAFAMARHLVDLDADVTIFHTRAAGKYRGESATNLKLCKKLGIPMLHVRRVTAHALAQPDIIIDGILGTGFSGELRKDTLKLIRIMNRQGERAFVFSIDIPSGLNGTTGKPQPDAVRADATATFEAAKIGLTQPHTHEYTGTLHICPIGIPAQVREKFSPRRSLITESILDHIPMPGTGMHKGSSGHVLIIGGSQGLTGAPHLAAMGALRAGAGLVTIACPGALAAEIKAGKPDIMMWPLGLDSTWKPENVSELAACMKRFDAVVVGPGLGRSIKTVDFLKELVASCSLPLVLDADALHALAQVPELVENLSETTILTPHPGEMAALTKTTSAAIQDGRISTAEEFAAATKAVLVLKGAGTIVANREKTCLSPIAAPNLAVGGSGDVLSGLLGTLLAQGLAPLTAACLGVFWHGVAGLSLESGFPLRGNLAHEIADALPTVFKELYDDHR